jgi:hypothetical protein
MIKYKQITDRKKYDNCHLQEKNITSTFMTLLIKIFKKMKKKLLGGIAMLAIAGVSAANVVMNSQNNELSSLEFANVEALAESRESVPGGNQPLYDEVTQETDYFNNKVLFKKSVITNCYEGGNNSCHSECAYKVKYEDGTWTDWIPC